MRIRKYYRCDYTEKLYQALLKHQISFQYDRELNWITFYLYEDHPNIEQIKSFLPHEVFGEYVFSDLELKNSEWLLMRSTNGKLENKNTEKTFALSCKYEKNVANHKVEFAHHRKQIAPFEFSIPIKWGQSHFYSSIWGGFYHIFCDDIAMNLIQNQDYVGIQFAPVIAYKKGCYAENIHQMIFSQVLPDEALILDNGFQRTPCPLCGQIQYTYNMLSRIQVKKSFLGISDFYRTNEIFGDGFADPFLIVSNRVFRTLTQFKLTKNIEFQPLLLQ